MPDYSRSIDVLTAADKAFAFVSDVGNLPRYVPTTRKAEESGNGKVHVEGVANGEDYANDGHIFIDPEQRLMRWGSGESAYRGELTVTDAGAGSHVAIKLHFHDGGHTPDASTIEQSLDDSLQRLKSELA